MLVSTGAGVVGSQAWRSSIRDQALHEFLRQSDNARAEFQERLTWLDPLFTMTEPAFRNGKPLGPELSRQDLIKSYPGTLSVGHAVTDAAGTTRTTDEFSVVASSGIANLPPDGRSGRS